MKGDSRLTQGMTDSGDPSADGGDVWGPTDGTGGVVGSQSPSSKSEYSWQEKLSTRLAQLLHPCGVALAGCLLPPVASAAVDLLPGAGVLQGKLRLGLSAARCGLLPAWLSLTNVAAVTW